jgi:Neuraminidase (sialidase)
VDVYNSNDNGANWELISTPVPVGNSCNPPHLLKLKDGRICLTYGRRIEPFGIRARISSDNGKTWGKEIILRNDGREWDLGYTRDLQRADGKIVTIYYYTTKENARQHIAATIWDPSEND